MTNIGEKNAIGSWSDSVYLYQDGQTPLRLAQQARSVGLGKGQRYTTTLQVTLPSDLADGNYILRVIARLYFVTLAADTERPLKPKNDEAAIAKDAGSLAAEWTWERLSATRRFWLRVLPGRLRARAACRLTRALAADAWEDTTAMVRWRRGVGSLAIAALTYVVMSIDILAYWVTVFPEVNLVVLGLIVTLGRYTGFRLSELSRFRQLAVKTDKAVGAEQP